MTAVAPFLLLNECCLCDCRIHSCLPPKMQKSRCSDFCASCIRQISQEYIDLRRSRVEDDTWNRERERDIRDHMGIMP